MIFLYFLLLLISKRSFCSVIISFLEHPTFIFGEQYLLILVNGITILFIFFSLWIYLISITWRKNLLKSEG